MLLISSTGIIWYFDTANSWTWVSNIMRYIEPQVRYIAAKYWTLLKNIEPKVQYIMAAIYWTPLWFSFAIGERGFKISWPWYINPLPLSNSNWRRGSKYYVLIYRTSDYHCYCRRGSKYYGCNHWTPLYFQLERGFKISWSWYNDTLLRDTRS